MITNNVKAGTKQVVQKQKEEHSAPEEKIKKMQHEDFDYE